MHLDNLNRRSAALGAVAFTLAVALQGGVNETIYLVSSLALLGVLLLVYSAWDVAIAGAVLPNAKIPLTNAARRMYEISRHKTWGKAAERFSDSPECSLNYFANALCGRVPIYGKYPPSNIRYVIPVSEFRLYKLKEGGSRLSNDAGTYGYTDLAVTRADLRRALKLFEAQEDSAGKDL
jgi:hypothetical protein